jgi:hypothetical protein
VRTRALTEEHAMSRATDLAVTRKPNRVEHAYTQTLEATPDEVFPLLCPVRELDWAPGWTTDWVISTSGVVEQDCVFRTPPKDGASEPSTWVVTRHEPARHEVEMFKFTPDHSVTKLSISLAPYETNRTRARVVYACTSLGPAGDGYLREFTAEWYEGFMRKWEAAMNHYLRTGERIG